jgi:hypothetical protein
MIYHQFCWGTYNSRSLCAFNPLRLGPHERTKCVRCRNRKKPIDPNIRVRACLAICFFLFIQRTSQSALQRTHSVHSCGPSLTDPLTHTILMKRSPAYYGLCFLLMLVWRPDCWLTAFRFFRLPQLRFKPLSLFTICLPLTLDRII